MFLFSSYDDEIDKVNQYQRLSLEALEKIEIGKKTVTLCLFLNALNNGLSTYQSILQMYGSSSP